MRAAWALHNCSALFLVLCLVSSGPVVAQTTHNVTVGNNFFSPNDLTIEVGDTVVWTNAAGGPSHDVTADDFSFNSVTAPGFTFQRTFNTAAEVLYHCTVHSSPGNNINTFQNGRILVEAVEEPVFQINAGLNDSWKNPLTRRQGFFISVFPDLQQMFLAWFTYDVVQPDEDVTAILGSPTHRWLTAFGDYSDDTAVLDIELTQGGIFDSADPFPSQVAGYGTITVKFPDCSNGELEYEIPSLELTGSMSIVRITQDNVALCEALADP